MSNTRPFRVGDVTTVAKGFEGSTGIFKGQKITITSVTEGGPWPVRGKIEGSGHGLFKLKELTPIIIPEEPSMPMTKAVLDLLKSKGSITSMEAQGVIRCRALPKRISELKELGWSITREFCKDLTGQRYARYHLETKAA